MGIPKKIHYCWFGRNPLTERAKSCIASWKRYCPDYEITEWNEDNFDVGEIRYTRQAYEAGKWAFVSDYARLAVVYRHGGIYLDTDVELVKRPDELLGEPLVLAMERSNCTVNTGLGFAAQQGNETLRELMDMYRELSFVMEDGSLNLKACPMYTTEFFEQRGYVTKNCTQRIGEALILASEYFCPMDYYTGVVEVTADTIGIHWYEASWFDEGGRKIHSVEQRIRRQFPKGLSEVLCYVYRKAYRLLEYMKKGVLLERLGTGKSIWKHHT